MLRRRRTITDLVHGQLTDEYRKNRFEYFEREKPDFIPLFVGFDGDDMIYRYLLHRDTHFNHLLFAFRKRRKIEATYAIFSLIEIEDKDGKIKGVAATHNSTIQDLYNEYKQKDGFLYVYLKYENTFG